MSRSQVSRLLLAVLLSSAAVGACADRESPVAPNSVTSTKRPPLAMYVDMSCSYLNFYWNCVSDGDWVGSDPMSDPVYTFCQANQSACTFWQGGTGVANPANPVPIPDSDDGAERAKPNCNNTQTNVMLKAWCSGSAPTGIAASRINNAVSAMRLVGGTCVALANIVDSVLARGDLHLFVPDTSFTFSGFAPVDGGASGPNSYIGLSNYWVTVSWDNNRVSHSANGTVMTLQTVLAHEADHLYGNGDTQNPAATANSQTCGGF